MLLSSLFLYSLDLTPIKEEGGYFTYYSLGKSQLEEGKYPWALIKAAQFSLTPEVLADLASYYLSINNTVAARACIEVLLSRFKKYAETDPYFKEVIAKTILSSGDPEKALKFAYETPFFEDVRKKVVVYRTLKKLIQKSELIKIEPEEENPFYSFFQNPTYSRAISVLLAAGLKEENIEEKRPAKFMYTVAIIIAGIILLMTTLRAGTFKNLQKRKTRKLIDGTIRKLEENARRSKASSRTTRKKNRISKPIIRKKKDRVRILLKKANKFLEEGKTSKALAYLKAAEKLNPNHPEIIMLKNRLQ